MINWTILLAAKAVEKTAEGGLFDINATLPLMAIQFLVLVALLNALFYKPLGKAIDERSDYVRNQLQQAREKKEKTENLAKQYEQSLIEVRRKAQEVIGNAQSEAQKIVAEKIQEAQQEVLLEKQKAALEIDSQKAQAFQTLEQQVEAISQEIIAKILGPELV